MAPALAGVHSADAGPPAGRLIPPRLCALLRLFSQTRRTWWSRRDEERNNGAQKMEYQRSTLVWGSGRGTSSHREFRDHRTFGGSGLAFKDGTGPHDPESSGIQIATLAHIHLSSWPAGDDSLPSATAWLMDVICWVRNDMLPWSYAWAAAALINSFGFT